jgi:hypothetical protein
MYSPTFDDELYKKCVIDWINDNEELFSNNLCKRRRHDRTLKIDYWDTAWGEMLRHPHIKIGNSKIGR